MKGWRTAYIFRLRGSVLLTGTASGVRGAQETSVTNGAAGAVPVRTCRVFQAWVSLGEPSADPLSTWGKQFCSIALTYIMSPVFRIENFPGSVPPALGPYCEFGSLRRLLPPTVPISDQESRSNFVWLAPLRIYYKYEYTKNRLHERGRFQQQNSACITGNQQPYRWVGSELTVHDFRDSLGGDIDQQVRLFRRFVLRANSRQSV